MREEDPADVNRSKFLRELQRLWGGQLGPISVIEVAHLIGSLIGLDWPDSQYLAAYANDPEARLQRAFELTQILLQRLCTLRPTVLMLDDLQWADTSSLDLLALCSNPTDDPLSLLVLGGARPEFLRQSPRWTNIADQITLSPLSTNACHGSRSLPGAALAAGDCVGGAGSESRGEPIFSGRDGEKPGESRYERG